MKVIFSCHQLLIIIFFKETADLRTLNFTHVVHTPAKFKFEVTLNLGMQHLHDKVNRTKLDLHTVCSVHTVEKWS